MIRKCAVALPLLLLLSVTTAQDSFNRLFLRGNNAYDNGDYQAALSSYQQIYRQGITNGQLFYNIGNCYHQLGDTGRAVQFYEKARQLLPRDNDVLANLKLAQTLTQDEVATADVSPLWRWINNLPHSFSIQELASAFAAAWWLLFLALLGILFPFHPNLSRILKRLIGIPIVLSLILATILAVRLYRTHAHEYGVILPGEQMVRSGPGPDFTEVFAVHAGLKVEVETARKDWLQVSLPNGLTGWVPEESLGRI